MTQKSTGQEKCDRFRIEEVNTMLSMSIKRREKTVENFSKLLKSHFDRKINPLLFSLNKAFLDPSHTQFMTNSSNTMLFTNDST